jgi:hypothetical protein
MADRRKKEFRQKSPFSNKKFRFAFLEFHYFYFLAPKVKTVILIIRNAPYYLFLSQKDLLFWLGQSAVF